MHLAGPSEVHLINSAEVMLDRVESLMLEFNPAEIKPDQIADLQKLPQSKRLSLKIPRRKYFRIRDKLKRFTGINIREFDLFPPLYTLNVIYAGFLTDKESFSMDFHLFQKAMRRKMPVTGLESVEDQTKIIKAIPLEQQISSLEDFSKRVDVHRKRILRSASLYRDQKIHELYRYNKNQMGPIRRQLIYERNFRMADKIEEQLREQTALIAVGAGHLSGRFGLIRLLKRCGYRLKPVKNIKSDL